MTELEISENIEYSHTFSCQVRLLDALTDIDTLNAKVCEGQLRSQMKVTLGRSKVGQTLDHDLCRSVLKGEQK